jgi:hypothetical protein
VDVVAHADRPTRRSDDSVLRIVGNQAAQREFMRDRGPGWTLFQGGLGSGKSWGGARKFLWLHAHNGCPGLMVAPTYGDLWRFMVPAIVAACMQLAWPCKIVRGDFPHLIVLGQIVYLISAENPERFAGFEVGHIWIDEGARIQTSLEDPLRDAPTQIRSRLRHPLARILHGMVTTTPEGVDTWVERDWFTKKLPRHRAYIGSTLLNTSLPAEYVEQLKASLPAELVEQYLAGHAVSYVANRAHPTFSKTRHASTPFEWVAGVPVHLGCDYNVSPMGWVAIQTVGEEVRVVDEVYLPDFATVDAAVHAAHTKGWHRSGSTDPQARLGHVVFHPDKSAKARSTVGDPEFTVMANTARTLGWSHTGDPYGVNPPVQPRINLVSRLILDATGRARLSVHPRCVRTIEDLERTGRASNGYDPGPEGKRGHLLDGLGYACWDLVQPMGKMSSSDLL